MQKHLLRFDADAHRTPPCSTFSDLHEQSLEQLRETWASMFESNAPENFYRDRLIKVMAYQRQARVEGDLSLRLQKELRTLAAGDGRAGRRKTSAALALSSGTRLVRTWRGALHEVTVLEHGYEWRGESFSSLSRIAREITGVRWNGLRFFGARRSLPDQAARRG